MDLHKGIVRERIIFAALFVISLFFIATIYNLSYDNQEKLFSKVKDIENKNYNEISDYLNKKSKDEQCVLDDIVVMCKKISYNGYLGFGKYNLEISNINGLIDIKVTKNYKSTLFIIFQTIIWLLSGIFLGYLLKQLVIKIIIDAEVAKLKNKIEEIQEAQVKIDEDEARLKKEKEKAKKTKEEEQLIKEKEKELHKRRIKLEKRTKKHYIKLYRTRYGKKVYLDDETDYFRFRNYNNVFLHRDIYKKHYASFDSTNHVHHIDGNHYNNEIWNLIELDEYTHRRINHAKLDILNYMSGINELKRIGITIDKMPKYVREKVKNL